MARKEVTEQELIAIINNELAKREECTGCRVRGIMALQQPDGDGCNWSEPIVSCSGVPASVCLATANQLVAQTRARFNLKP